MNSFQALKAQLLQQGAQHRIAAVCADDTATREALNLVEQEGIAKVINVTADTPEEAAAEAVALVRRGEADILMKGLIGTDKLLRAVLNKECGLLPQGNVLTHLAAAEIPAYQKLLFFTDAAVIPYPTHEQRIEQVRYATQVCRRLGISEPKVALIHCAEHGGKAFPFVDGYADICRMAAAGDFGPCVVDGPLDLLTSLSPEALAAKRLTSPIGGEADILILPDIEAGNVFYKTLSLLANARTAGILCGTTAPVVVPSRGDSTETKFNSILFALASL